MSKVSASGHLRCKVVRAAAGRGHEHHVGIPWTKKGRRFSKVIVILRRDP